MSMTLATLFAAQPKSPKLKRDQILALEQEKDYSDGRTKQSFKDETDINKILKRAQKTGTISHLAKYEARYGDFTGFDFFEAQVKLTQGRQIFDDLPSEIRNEFSHNQAAFFDYVNDPANKDRLGELLPDLAAPGRQALDLRPIKDSADVLAAAEAANNPPVDPPAASPADPSAEPPADPPA